MPSAVIRRFAYDPARQVLTITFVSGRAYAYQGVPAGVAEGLRLAFAKGEYFKGDPRPLRRRPGRPWNRGGAGIALLGSAAWRIGRTGRPVRELAL
jgi:hypothetical protein